MYSDFDVAFTDIKIFSTKLWEKCPFGFSQLDTYLNEEDNITYGRNPISIVTCHHLQTKYSPQLESKSDLNKQIRISVPLYNHLYWNIKYNDII